MKERWIPGLWLGKRWSTDEHVVSAASGRVVRARDVRLFPADKAFDVNFAKNVVGTPSNPSVVENEETVLHDIPRAPVARPEDPASAPVTRQVILLKACFERFGHSADCSMCRAMMRGEIVGPSHTVACRNRVESEMEKDPILKQRLEAARERRDRYLVGEVARGSTQHAPVPQQRDEQELGPSSHRQEEDKIPEVPKDDGAEVEPMSKRYRAGAQNPPKETSEVVVDGSAASEIPVSETIPEQSNVREEVNEDEQDEPNQKRMRTSTLSMERSRPLKVCVSKDQRMRSDTDGLAIADDGSL